MSYIKCAVLENKIDHLESKIAKIDTDGTKYSKQQEKE